MQANFIGGRKKIFKKKNISLFKNARPIILNRFDSVDINTPEDWLHAELLFKNKKNFFHEK